MTSGPHPIRVLIVEDHAVVRTGLRMLIESQPGLAIAGEAVSRAEAIEVTAREQPDIVLLDLDLGGELVLNSIPDLLAAAPAARVLVLTGVRDPELPRQALRAGAVGVVRKEQAAQVLLAAIAKVHAGEVWIHRSEMASVLQEMRREARRPEPDAARIAMLTMREREVIALIGEALKNQDIADRLHIAETTVRHHLTSIFDKLEVSDRLALVIYAFRHGLAEPPSR